MRTQFSPTETLLLFSLVSLCIKVSANQELCELPPVTGPCRAAFPRWYYNSTVGECLEFTYGGCMGNGNNFHTENNCTETCVPSVVAKKDVEADEKTVRTYFKLVKNGEQPEIPVPFFSVKRRFRREALNLSSFNDSKVMRKKVTAPSPTDSPRQEEDSREKVSNPIDDPSVTTNKLGSRDGGGDDASAEQSASPTPKKSEEVDGDGKDDVSAEQSVAPTPKKIKEVDGDRKDDVSAEQSVAPTLKKIKKVDGDGKDDVSAEQSVAPTLKKMKEVDGDGIKDDVSAEQSVAPTPKKIKEVDGDGKDDLSAEQSVASSKSKKEDQIEEGLKEDYSLEYRKNSGIYRGSDPLEHTSSHFAAFFLTAIVMVFAAYVVYHNRQKIVAIIIEGQNNTGRRRGYRKLETNVEEAMPSMKSANSTYVY